MSAPQVPGKVWASLGAAVIAIVAGVFAVEGGYSNSSGIEKLSLFNRAGERVSCELLVQEDVLQRWLRDRIVLGVKNFFTALHAAFASRMPEAVHILLAGNASRSASRAPTEKPMMASSGIRIAASRNGSRQWR